MEELKSSQHTVVDLVPLDETDGSCALIIVTVDWHS